MIKLKTITFLLLLVTLSGCGLYRAPTPEADYCYLNPNKNLYDIGRVVIVELDNDSGYPQISTDLTYSLFEALQKKQLFSIRVITQNEPEWRSLQLEVSSSYTLEQLFTAHKTLRCDAIIIGTVTQYKPYPHMTIGLNLKLIDLYDGQLAWAFEQVWDGSERKTQYRIKEYLRNQIQKGSTTMSEQLVTVSPIKFVKFVAYEVSETL